MNPDIGKYAAEGGRKSRKNGNKKPPGVFSKSKQRIFLERLASGEASMPKICKGLGISKSTPFHLARRDPEFKQAWQDAKAIRREMLESVADQIEEGAAAHALSKIENSWEGGISTTEMADDERAVNISRKLRGESQVLVQTAIQINVAEVEDKIDSFLDGDDS